MLKRVQFTLLLYHLCIILLLCLLSRVYTIDQWHSQCVCRQVVEYILEVISIEIRKVQLAATMQFGEYEFGKNPSGVLRLSN